MEAAPVRESTAAWVDLRFNIACLSSGSRPRLLALAARRSRSRHFCSAPASKIVLDRSCTTEQQRASRSSCIDEGGYDRPVALSKLSNNVHATRRATVIFN